MGTIWSHKEEIDNLHFDPLENGKKIKGTIVLVDGVVVVQSEKGRLYANKKDLGAKVCYVPGNWPWTDAAMKCLVKLGIISQEIADEHVRRCEVRSLRRSADSCLEYDVPRLKKFGIELSEEQIAVLKKAAGK